jgi:hypothetical protein
VLTLAAAGETALAQATATIKVKSAPVLTKLLFV